MGFPVESLYVHVPFCVKKCRYCDFYSIEGGGELIGRYLAALEKEMFLYSEYLQKVKTVYIGGGTPTVLGMEQLERLLGTVLRVVRFDHPSGYEFTIEANPATVDEDKISLLLEHGVNRMSIGVQSFNDGLLSFLGRVHDSDQAEKTIELVGRNFENFSIDLIYGIPGQDDKDWESSLRRALSFVPAHISAYELTPEEQTPLSGDIISGRTEMPGEDEVLRLYWIAADVLRQKGYVHYEISNYARPGYESRHNLNYWRRGDYVGAGPSAHSLIGGRRVSNYSDIVKYCEALEKGGLPLERSIQLTPKDELEEEIFLGLRTGEGIDWKRLLAETARLGDGSPDETAFREALSGHVNEGLVVLEGERLLLAERGFALSNRIIADVMKFMGL